MPLGKLLASSGKPLGKLWRSSEAAFCMLKENPMKTPMAIPTETFIQTLMRTPIGSCMKTSLEVQWESPWKFLGLPQGLLGASHKDFPVNSSREALRKVWRSSGAAFCLLWGLPLETPVETFMEILTRIPMGSCIKTS